MAEFSRKGLLAVTVLVCGRLVPKDTFGNYMFLMSFYQIFSVVAGAGIPNILVRQVAAASVWRPAFLTGSIAARAVYSLPAAALMFSFFFIARYPIGFLPALGVLGALIVLRAATENAIAIFQGREETTTCAAISFVQSAVTLICTLVVCLTTKDLLQLVSCHILGAVASIVFAFFMFRRRKLSLYFGLAGLVSYTRVLLAETGWMNGATLISSAYNRCDVLLLERMASAQAVATYSAPYRVLDLAQIIPQGIMGVILARISRRDDGTTRKVDQATVMTIMMLAAVTLIVVSTMLAPVLVPLALGRAYADSVRVVAVLVWAVPFMYCNSALNVNFIARRAEKFVFYGCLSALLFNLATNLILIPRFNYMAAAVNTVGTELILFALNREFCRRAGISFKVGYLAPIGFAMLLAGIGAAFWMSSRRHHLALGSVSLCSSLIVVALIFRQIRGKIPSLQHVQN
jgi:O-antigen/teichoic acid export membrane protein